MGEPNVGKSSLINALVKEQVSVVTQTPGTTREQIRGILTGNGYQIVFLDTPGMNSSDDTLGKFMRKSISAAVAGSDVIVYVVDATEPGFAGQIQKIRNYEGKSTPVIVAVSKTDKTTLEKLYPKLGAMNTLGYVKAIVPVSAVTGFNLNILVDEVVKVLPVGTKRFDKDFFTDQSVRKMCGEILRGELFKLLRAEVPHGVAVNITEWVEKPDGVDINADILCQKESHKPIIIGKGGAMLKAAGVEARKAMEELLGKHVRLNTNVLVREKWRDKKEMVEELGYKH